MNDVARRIELAYRETVAVTPYSSISVVGLCERAGISRKMFYRHFKSKDDVLRSVFDRDVVVPQVELCRLLSFEKMAAHAPTMEYHEFKSVHNDGEFYRNVVTAPQGGEEAFAVMASSAFDKFNHIMLDEYGYKGSRTEVGYIAAFFAEAKARMMAKWIREDYPLQPREASELYARMILPFWSSVI